MSPLIRRLLMLPVAVFALVALVGMFGAAHARGDGGASPDDEDGAILDYVPVRGDAVSMALHAVWIQHQGQVYMVDASRGVMVKSQNKLPLGGLPLIGGLFDSGYVRGDFSEAKKVADVYASDESFVIALPDYLDLPGGVAVINQSNGFFFQKPPAQAGGLPSVMSDAPVGGAFFHAKDNKLLILIRPSVVTDSALF